MANPFYMSDCSQWMLFIMLLIAFGIKLPIFPFHTWMLKVHTEAPPAVVMIHSGILLKMGAYGLDPLRNSSLSERKRKQLGAGCSRSLVSSTSCTAPLLAMVQKDFKLAAGLLEYQPYGHRPARTRCIERIRPARSHVPT